MPQVTSLRIAQRISCTVHYENAPAIPRRSPEVLHGPSGLLGSVISLTDLGGRFVGVSSPRNRATRLALSVLHTVPSNRVRVIIFIVLALVLGGAPERFAHEAETEAHVRFPGQSV